jgi:DNA modification methylase
VIYSTHQFTDGSEIMAKQDAEKRERPDIEQLQLSQLIPFVNNSRTHSDAQIAQIAASIKEFGFTNPILIDGENGIIAGHGRVLAARKLGITDIPCIRLGHLTDVQKRAYVIADNKLALNAGWDADLLLLEIKGLEEVDFDLSLTGFTPEEIDKMILDDVMEGLTEEDTIPDSPVNPVTKFGDVWLLGNHRVICGDSTNKQHVEIVTNGKIFDICFTSPPYALGKSAALSGNKSISANGKAYDAHDDSPKEWPDLMNGWWSASVGHVSAWVVNLQPLAGNKRELFRWIGDRINQLVDVATWDKGHGAPQMAQGVMTSRFEWILIFGESNASRVIPFASWHGNVQNVYDAPPQRGNEFAKVHGATMPVHLAEWVIGTLCNKSKSVFEPFGGTGTTIIACEKLGKMCAAIEISPAYVDIMINRWQDFTGKQAIHEQSGKTFDEVSND